MKWLLVMMLCWGTDCQTIYKQTFYDDEIECMEQLAIVSESAKKQFPNASGQIWCVTEEEFKKWMKPTSGA